MEDATNRAKPVEILDKTNFKRSGNGWILIALGAVIFIGLAAAMVYALLDTSGTSSASDNVPGPAAAVAQGSNPTLEALLATAVDDEDERATMRAVIQQEINNAVEATLFALTPTATPLPTDVPLADTMADHNPSLGPEDAPVTIVEFSDYLCGFCGRFHSQTLDPLLEHYGDLIRFVYREYPVIGGQTSAAIGAAAQCANEQGKYWEYSDLIWDNQLGDQRQQWSAELLASFAQEAELDIDDYNQCLEDETGFNNVVTDFEAGRAFNVTGTPTFFINGERLVGAQPIEAFFEVIDRQLEAQGVEPPPRP
jgi:protein-disulfide isomerase